MDITEKLDEALTLRDLKNLEIADQFILPSQTIISYDLTCHSNNIIHDYHETANTPLILSPKNPNEVSIYCEEKVSNNIDNGLDHLQHNDLIVMANHAAHHIASSDSSIWVPADKHPQIAPSEYENWIKTHTNGGQNPNVNVSRKRSVLSNVSYNSTEEDSCGSETSDDEDEPITPTLMTVLPREEMNSVNKDHQSESNLNGQKECIDNSNDILPRRQDTCTNGQGQENGSSNSFGLVIPSNLMPNQITNPKEDNIYITSNKDMVKNDTTQTPIKQLNSMNMQHLEMRNNPLENVDRRPPIQTSEKGKQFTKNSMKVDQLENSKKSSWFKDLFQHNKPKKTGIMAGLFSIRSSKKSGDIPTTSLMKKLSNSAMNLNSSSSKLKKQQSESTLKRMSLPLKKKLVKQTEPYVHTRYPIHTERAIYRLSHIKLSNPRRPLRQQVAISNMMFWYLAITERQQEKSYFVENQHNYQANQRAQPYFNDLYQTTCQPFEQPASRSPYGYPSHQIPNFTHQHRENGSNIASPPSSQQHLPAFAEENSSMNTEKNKLKKSKYKPVRNKQYKPS